MGRQIQFHMLPADLKSFLEFATSNAPLFITERSNLTDEIRPVSQAEEGNFTLTIWNKNVLPGLNRKEVRRGGAAAYYRVDGDLPVIELTPSRMVTWDGNAALLQGRMYASFHQTDDRFAAWYRTLDRWLRKNLDNGPCSTIGGLIGCGAAKWFREGGVLLPMFVPPITEAWIRVAADQCERRKTPLPAVTAQ